MTNDYKVELNTRRKNAINVFFKNPLFGFVILIFLLVVAQFLHVNGMIGISIMRAFGKTISYTIVALGFSLLLGYAGLASLGTAGFIGLGTYIYGNLIDDHNYPLALIFLIIILIAVILGGIVGFISLRIEGMYLAIITLGISEIFLSFFESASDFTGGTTGLRWTEYPKLFTFFELNRDTTFFFLLAILFVVLVLTYNIINSPTGRAMLAMKNSESAAQAMGISTLKYRLLAFVLATVYAMIGGILTSAYTRSSNTTSWTLGLSLNILAAVILGGARSIWGVIVGTFIIFGFDLAILKNIPYFQQNPNATLIFSGVLIIIIVMFYPGGLVRLFYDIKNFIKKLKRKWKVYRYGEDI